MINHENKPVKITIETIFTKQKEICNAIIGKEGIKNLQRKLSLMIFCSSAVYGFTMGIRHSYTQALCSCFKVPLLFYATLMICIPTLHFIGLLVGSRIRFSQTMNVLLLGISVNSVLLSAFAPISLFFLLTGSSYPFMMLMHVAIFTFCGAAGLDSIKKNIRYLRKIQPGGNHKGAKYLLFIWMLLYMFVGTQMAYVLAPFVGKVSDFMFFRTPKGNFYSYLFEIIGEALR